MLTFSRNTTLIRRFLKRILTGLSISQEYVCLDKTDFLHPLRVSLIVKHNEIIDATESHLFLGYKPLVIGLIFQKTEHNVAINKEYITLSFSDHLRKRVAFLQVKKVTQYELGDFTVIFYEGQHGGHEFLNRAHRWMNVLMEKFRSRKAGNVSLPGNLYEQVRIAYAIPRIISLITTSDGVNMNLFPTDLHGAVGKNFYVGSLRINGLANKQVEEYKKIVISEVEAKSFKLAYGYGVNHMKPLRNKDQFELSGLHSKQFGFELPKGVVRYRELTEINSFDCGIHRIHIYQIVHQENFENRSLLAHIHQYYAQWRIDHGLPNRFLIR